MRYLRDRIINLSFITFASLIHYKFPTRSRWHQLHHNLGVSSHEFHNLTPLLLVRDPLNVYFDLKVSLGRIIKLWFGIHIIILSFIVFCDAPGWTMLTTKPILLIWLSDLYIKLIFVTRTTWCIFLLKLLVFDAHVYHLLFQVFDYLEGSIHIDHRPFEVSSACSSLIILIINIDDMSLVGREYSRDEALDSAMHLVLVNGILHVLVMAFVVEFIQLLIVWVHNIII